MNFRSVFFGLCEKRRNEEQHNRQHFPVAAEQVQEDPRCEISTGTIVFTFRDSISVFNAGPSGLTHPSNSWFWFNLDITLSKGSGQCPNIFDIRSALFGPLIRRCIKSHINNMTLDALKIRYQKCAKRRGLSMIHPRGPNTLVLRLRQSNSACSHCNISPPDSAISIN